MNTKLKIGIILLIIIVLIGIYASSSYTYLKTIFVTLQIISIFSTFILLGTFPSYLVYVLYWKIFKESLTKRKLKSLSGLNEYMDISLFEVVIPMGFSSIMLVNFKILDQFIFSY